MVHVTHDQILILSRIHQEEIDNLAEWCRENNLLLIVTL